MKKLITIFVICALVTLFYSCRKDISDILDGKLMEEETLFDPQTKMNYILATKYYSQVLKKEQGDKVNLKSLRGLAGEENLKHLMFSKTYTSENKRSSFVEVPLFYNRKSSTLIFSEGSSTEDKKAILRASFDRLVIYKDKITGKIDQRIIRYIPSVEYLKKHNYKISHNQINKLDKDFDGFLQYQKWDGTPLYFLEIHKGRRIKTVKWDKEKKKDNRIKTSQEMCNVYCWEEWEEDCSNDNPETSTEECDWNLVDSGCDILNCWEEPDPGQGDPCADYGDCPPVPDPPQDPDPEKTYITDTVYISPPDIELEDEDYENVYVASTMPMLYTTQPVRLKIKPTYFLVEREYPGGRVTGVDQHALQVEPIYAYYTDKYGRIATRYAELQFQVYNFDYLSSTVIKAWWRCTVYRRWNWAGVASSKTTSSPYYYEKID